MNQKVNLLKFLFLLNMMLFITSCSTEPYNDSSISESKEQQDSPGLSTVPIEESIKFFESWNTEQNRAPTGDLDLDIDLSTLRQVDVTNTSARITLIDAQTNFDDVVSTIMQINIDGSVQTVLYNTFPRGNPDTPNTEDVVVTTLSGEVLNNFEYESETLNEEVMLSSYLPGDDPDPSCWGITCGIELEEVYLSNAPSNSNWAYNYYANTTNVMMNYQFERSMNNYTSMGVAYANYYRSLAFESNFLYSPDIPINDVAKYLECFDITKGAVITVYVDQPIPNQEDAYDIVLQGIRPAAVVGHTFVSIEQDNNIAVFGYYPVTNDVNPRNPIDVGILGNDEGEHFDVSASASVSGGVLSQILDYAINYNNTYNLNTYNCSDFGIEIGNLAGMNLPPSDGTWYGGGGSNPGALGQHIRNNSNAYIVNDIGGNAPQNHKGC